MRRGRLTAAVMFCLMLGAAGATAASEPRADPSAQARAGFAGWWQAEPPFVVITMPFSPPPLKPAAAAAYQAATQAIAAGGAPDYCHPLRFTGYSYGIGGDMEFLFTPGRATLISNDVGLVRRIYIGMAAPSKPVPTNSGTSIGRWEGDVLVVRTIGLDPATPYPSPMPGAPALGENAQVVERIYLADKDTLVFEIEMTAPDVLTAPDRRRQAYRRVNKQIDYAMSFCSAQDRSVDAAGRQQFDMTPPKDLPPPPPG